MPGSGLDDIWRSARQGVEWWMRSAPHHVTHDERGAWVVGSGAQVAADYNPGRVGVETDHAAFEGLLSFLEDADIPAMLCVAPEAAVQLGEVATERGLVDTGMTMPVMVHSGPISAESSGFDIARVDTVDSMRAVAALLEDPFDIPLETNAEVYSAELLEERDVLVWLARSNDEPVSTVTATFADGLAGIWAMGTATKHQRRGAGRALLSSAMAEIRAMGIESCFLLATPAGFPLYQRLGYRTVEEPRVWLRGHSTEFPT